MTQERGERNQLGAHVSGDATFWRPTSRHLDTASVELHDSSLDGNWIHHPDRVRVEEVIELATHCGKATCLDLDQFSVTNKVNNEPIERDLHHVAILAVPLLERGMQGFLVEDTDSRHSATIPPASVSDRFFIWHNRPMNATPALSDPRLGGIAHEVVRHEKVNSLDEAAALRGVEARAIIKTMVVRRGEDDYVFVLVPGDRVIDWSKLRNHLDERRLSMPDAEEALSVTGYVRGTITPFGSKSTWPVFADERLTDMTVSIGGGAPGVSITIASADVVQVLDATVADLTKQRNEDRLP